MNKQAYLQALERALRANQVDDIEEVIAEYTAHFDFKSADGYSEEEIADRLEKPEIIAMQFASAGSDNAAKKNKAAVCIGLCFADIGVAAFFIILFAWVISIGAFSIASAAAGVCMVTGLNIAGLIPVMPYVPGLVMGICFLCLAVLSSAGTVYCWLYVAQLTRAYTRWHKNKFHSGASARPYPPLAKHPKLPGPFKRKLRGVTLAASVAFGFTFIVAMLLFFAYAGFQPFWHAWEWFL